MVVTHRYITNTRIQFFEKKKKVNIFALFENEEGNVTKARSQIDADCLSRVSDVVF